MHKNNEREQNRLDKESISFHEKVYEGYKELIQRYPDTNCYDRCKTSETDVIENVWKIVSVPTHVMYDSWYNKGKEGKRRDDREIDSSSCTRSG